MSTAVQIANQNLPANPFAKMMSAHANVGTVTTESERAIAEAQGKLVIAKRFPRDEAVAYAKVMEACSRPALAAVAMYSFPRGKETITGPSIRLAEELARCWGNIDFGIRELSRTDGTSEMQAYCWDLETNVMSTQNFTVKHVRDTRDGQKRLTDERDIYEMTANQGGRRLRARILAVMPPDLVDAAVEKCRQTLAGGSDTPIIDRIKKMVVAFAKLGVSEKLLTDRLGHPLADTTPDELADLLGIFTSIKDGVSKVDDWFGEAAQQPADDGGARAAIAAATQAPAAEKPARAPRQAKPEPEQAKPEPEQAPAPAPAPAAKAAAPAPAAAPAAEQQAQAADGDEGGFF